jgi:hypothetical protein
MNIVIASGAEQSHSICYDHDCFVVRLYGLLAMTDEIIIQRSQSLIPKETIYAG